jgi:hypothetical protein
MTKNRPHKAGVYVSATDVDLFPVFTTVAGLHEVGTRLVFRFQFINISLTNKPSILVIGKIDVPEDVCRGLRFCLPGFATIKRRQKRTSASHSPATVLIEKENCMKPRESRDPLPRPRTCLA